MKLESMSSPLTHQSNAFAKHKLEYQKGDDTRMDVKADVVKNFTRPMQRQVREGVEGEE